MIRDDHDILIDQLLREVLGGDRPRDLTTRVLERARLMDRARRTWWIGTGAAMAAGIAIAFLLWFAWPQQYAAPTVDNLLVSNRDLGPGTVVAAPDDSTGKISFGGYANVSLEPSTSLTLGGGSRYQESVFLEGGRLNVTTRNRGILDVVVGGATLRASNSRLAVDVTDDIDETRSAVIKRMVVKVLEGTALIRGIDAPATLKAGETREFIIPVENLLKDERGDLSPGARIVEPPAPGRVGRGLRRGISALPGTEGARLAQIQLVIGPGPYGMDGVLRHLGQYYILQSTNGNFFLGHRDVMPRETPQPGPKVYVHVVMSAGRVTRIEKIDSLPTSSAVSPPPSTPMSLTP
jgi:hypothetical protein